MKFSVKFHLSAEQAFYNFSHASCFESRNFSSISTYVGTFGTSSPSSAHPRLGRWSEYAATLPTHLVRQASCTKECQARACYCSCKFALNDKTYFWTGLALIDLFFRFLFVCVRPLLKSGPPKISRDAGPLTGRF